MAAAMWSSEGHSSSTSCRRHPSDPLEESASSLPPPNKKSRSKRNNTQSSEPGASREEQCRHKAIEKAFLKAQSHALNSERSVSQPPSVARSPRSVRDLSPDVLGNPQTVSPSEPQRLFQTLPDSEQSPALPPVPPLPPPPPLPTTPMADSLEAFISRAIRQTISECLNQAPASPALATSSQPHSGVQGSAWLDQEQSDFQVTLDQASVSEGEDYQDQAWSDDEGLGPDQLAFIGLFKPQLFCSLLFKAIAITRLGSPPSAAPSATDPAAAMFAEPTSDPETIPAPKLFTDMLQCQWALPGAGHSPNGLDKRLYNSASPLLDILQVPMVDPPIVALTDYSHPTGAPEDSLRPEDKRAEKTLLKGHQTTAWSIQASTSASFFNWAALLWLKQLQARLPLSDARSHQDLNKIAAALEYSADATLNSTHFSARVLGFNVASCRLLWLRNWQADMRSKWQLASAPYSSGALFGSALEPLLVETRD
ncbi:ligand-dependent nuclear receptor corepressor-like protein isoform X7 [Pantherophis guttatus]|uniref:Ligand-dependent nuclear receptor corepressor-like protein isoform X7 n=1 Tax=Pantherophis guttatus TaxID=94885 RepID=A0ABM3Z2X1_PANGU|nr:ligand-dependent nuclear receptor corepressor-like protein isoform X7 [Pantherophis guttatus]